MTVNTQKQVLIYANSMGPTGTWKGVRVYPGFTGATGQFPQWQQLAGGTGPTGTFDNLYDIGAATGAKGVIIPGYTGPNGGKLAANARLAAIGDSITLGSSGPTFLPFANQYAGCQYFIPPGGNLAVGGTSTDQMLASQAPSLAALLPKIVSVLGGTNDITGTGNTLGQITANLSAIYTSAFNAGASYVVAITVLPRNGLTGPQATLRTQINSWINSQASARIKVIDMDVAGFNATTMTVDGLHPNTAGALLIGSTMGAVLKTLSLVPNIFYATPSDYGDLLDNNDLAGTAGVLLGTATGSVATGWNAGPNVTGLTVTCTKTVDGAGFNHQVITVTGTSSGSGGVFFYRDFNATIPNGGIREDWGQVSLTGVSGAVTGLGPPEASGNSNWSQDMVGGVRIYPEVVSGGSSGSIRWQVAVLVGAGALGFTLDIARPTTRLAAGGQ